MDSLILDQTALKNHLKEIVSGQDFLIAYSGGLDSHVLLHLISQIPEFTVRAIHIHHGLQTVADSWVEHCQNTCKHLNTPFEVTHLNLKPEKGESIEAVARQGRYQALDSSLQTDEILLTAQHQNDQSETLLLQLFRGAGVQGLASMPETSHFGKGKHARPLLSVSRKDLEAYAKINQLNYIEDPSNQDIAFDRNYLRNNILPQLRNRWLGLDKALNRSASIQAETKEILDEVAKEDLAKICSTKNNTLSIKNLETLSHIRQKLLLRYWITQNHFTSPSKKKLQHIFTDIIQAQDDAQPLLEWQGVQIRRYQNKLFIMQTLSKHDPSQSFIWNTHTRLEIASLALTLKPEILHEKNQTVTVRFRQGGEVFNSPKRHKKISLKNLFSEAHIPPWKRSRIPLIYLEDELIQIIGLQTK